MRTAHDGSVPGCGFVPPKPIPTVSHGLLTLMLALVLTTPAQGNHETIDIDGNLTDLIGAIGRNPTSGKAIADAHGDVWTAKCPPYANGYDVENFYLFVDCITSDGGITDNPTLYAGWDVFGLVGDVDGDGNPSVYNPFGPHGGCALSDQIGIGLFESYRIFITWPGSGFEEIMIRDIDGDGFPNVVLTGGEMVPGAQVAASGSGLELRIPALGLLFPEVSVYDMTFDMSANSADDGLGEDFTDATITVGVEDASGGGVLRLDGARPNPAAGGLVIAFALSAPGAAKLELLDSAGRREWVREVGHYGPGRHTVDLRPAGDLPPGVYFVRLESGGRSLTRKVVVLDR